MNITVDKKENCIATLSIEVPADKVAEVRSNIVAAYTKQAKIKGFRPGKAPVSLIEKNYGSDIKAELEQRLINDACVEAVKKEELKALNIRIPEAPALGEDGTFKFTTEVTLAPSFELPEYKEIAVEIPGEEVTDEEMDASLEDLRARFADFKDVEGELADGQFAIIDFTSNIDGKSIEETIGKPAGFLDGREGHWVKIEDDSFLPGFAEQLKGAKAGDEKEVKVTINDEFPIEDLRGKEVAFDVTVKETKEQELPELDDEFAGKLLPEKGLDDLKEIIKEQLTTEKSRQIADSKVEQIVAHLNEAVDFELPSEIVEAETAGNAQAMVQRGVQQGMTEEQIAEQEEEIQTAAAEQAQTTLKTNFILQEIANAEGIEASDQDLIQRIAAMAQQEKKPAKKYLQELRRENRIESVRNSVLIGKTIDFLVENANVTVSENQTEEANA